MTSAGTETYSYEPNSNRLAEITGAREVTFGYNDVGAMTEMVEEWDGETVKVVEAGYNPNGLFSWKQDYLQDGATVTMGDTVVMRISPMGEMLEKENPSEVGLWFYAYDLSGNMLEQGSPTDLDNNPSSNEPLIDHIYLGGRRIATNLGSGQVCIIATVAYGSPLAEDLSVFRAFRDRALKKFSLGERFVGWYYENGPTGAAWLKGHEGARVATRYVLSAAAVPLRAAVFGRWWVWAGIGGVCLVFLLVVGGTSRSRSLGLTRGKALLLTFGLAFALVIGYSLLMDTEEARANYDEGAYYYYTEDHIGRPVNLRDADEQSPRDLAWWEQHEPFGELIDQDTPQGELLAGSTPYAITWTPPFRFPGQYQEEDMYPFTQNHYREYMAGEGRYNRVDPILPNMTCKLKNDAYGYSGCNPLLNIDNLGLFVRETCNQFGMKESIIEARRVVLEKIQKNPCCLEYLHPSKIDRIVQRIKNITYDCQNVWLLPLRGIEACAYNSGNVVVFANCPLAFNWTPPIKCPQCPCLPNLLLHEAIHADAPNMSENMVKREAANCFDYNCSFPEKKK